MWSKFYNKAELAGVERRTLQRVQNHSGIRCTATLLAVTAIWLSDFLVVHPVWTLRILAFTYVLVHTVTFFSLGLYRDGEQHATWPGDRHTKMRKKVLLICKAVLLHVFSIALFYITPVLFGAPLLSLFNETIHFSIFITALVTYSGWLLFGCDEHKWLRIILGTGPQTHWEKHWLRSATCSLVGAWLGAFVIPLDWDRPWQAWPICCTYGTLILYGVYHLCDYFILSSLLGKRSSVRSKIIK